MIGEIRKRLEEYEDLIINLYRIAEKIYRPIPGTSLVKTWVRGNGGKYEYWYYKGSGKSIYVGEIDISYDALEMAKIIKRRAPKAIQAIQILKSFLEIAEKADVLKLEATKEKVKKLLGSD